MEKLKKLLKKLNFKDMKLWQKILIVAIILIVVVAIIWGVSNLVTKRQEIGKEKELAKMVFSPKKDWGVYKISSGDPSKYTVQQWNNEDYVVTTYYVPIKKCNDCSTRFSVMKVDTKENIDKVKQKDELYKSGIKYTEKKFGEYTFYDLQHKQTKKDKIYAEGTHSGYFLKDGYTWAYQYERYKGVSKDLETQIINDVLKKMKIFE